MALEKVRAYFRQYGMAERIQQFPVSSATVALAAKALHCEPARIAKTLSFMGKDGTVLLVVAAGDARMDNAKFKACFQQRAKMLSAEEVESRVGHAVGGVCPFAVNEAVSVWLDISLQRFASVYPACGSSNSAIELTPDELERYSRSRGWVDVCSAWQTQGQG